MDVPDWKNLTKIIHEFQKKTTFLRQLVRFTTQLGTDIKRDRGNCKESVITVPFSLQQLPLSNGAYASASENGTMQEVMMLSDTLEQSVPFQDNTSGLRPPQPHAVINMQDSPVSRDRFQQA
jgi:hypothetical protein